MKGKKPTASFLLRRVKAGPGIKAAKADEKAPRVARALTVFIVEVVESRSSVVRLAVDLLLFCETERICCRFDGHPKNLYTRRGGLCEEPSQLEGRQSFAC